jgi:hypothetical protein
MPFIPADVSMYPAEWSIYNTGGLATSSSCLDPKQRLMTPQGSVTAEEIWCALEKGDAPALITSNPCIDAPCRAIGACRTETGGRQVRLESGEVLRLTNGHVVLTSPGTFCRKGGRGLFREDSCEYVRDLRVGMSLLGQRIVHITDVQYMRAIRIWTERPEWLMTPGGSAIGSRWHELFSAWCITGSEILRETGDDEPLHVPTDSIGWVHPSISPRRGRDRYSRRLHTADSPWEAKGILGSTEHMYRALNEYSWPISSHIRLDNIGAYRNVLILGPHAWQRGDHDVCWIPGTEVWADCARASVKDIWDGDTCIPAPSPRKREVQKVRVVNG